MAYPTSDNWYSILSAFSSPPEYFGVLDTGGTIPQLLPATVGMTTTTTVYSEWQFVPSPNNMYYIRNRDMGADVRLSVTTMGVQQYLGDSVTVDTVNFAAANDSDSNQEWTLDRSGDAFLIMGNTQPRGFLMNAKPWLGTSGAPGMFWDFGVRGTINDTSFSNTTTQTSPTPTPTATASTTPLSNSHRTALYIEIGASILALLLAIVIGYFLYRNNAARRKRLLLEAEDHELDYVHATFPTVRPRADPELPYYHEVRGHRRVNESGYDARTAPVPPPTYTPDGEEDPIASLRRSPPRQQPSQPPEYQDPSPRETVAGTVTEGDVSPIEREMNSTQPEDMEPSSPVSDISTAHDSPRGEETAESHIHNSEPDSSPETSTTIMNSSETSERGAPDESQAQNSAPEHPESPP